MHRLALLLSALTLLAGCATPGNNWGERATWRPGWERVKTAAIGAATDPGTWIPTAATAAIALTGNDKRYSDHYWATTPVFGSVDKGEHQSEELRDHLFQSHILSMLLTPSGDTPGSWFNNKLKGVVVQEGALGATRITNNLLKKNIDRKVPSYTPVRPDHESFPSNHATEPFAAAALIRRNVAQMPIPEWSQYSLTGLAYLTATGAAWGRVEIGLHYPTDQLGSAAIGNFVALFIHDAFMGEEAPQLGLNLGPDHWHAQLGWSF